MSLAAPPFNGVDAHNTRVYIVARALWNSHIPPHGWRTCHARRHSLLDEFAHANAWTALWRAVRAENSRANENKSQCATNRSRNYGAPSAVQILCACASFTSLRGLNTQKQTRENNRGPPPPMRPKWVLQSTTNWRIYCWYRSTASHPEWNAKEMYKWVP